MNPIGIQYLYWNDIPLADALSLTAASGADIFECGTTLIHSMKPAERIAFARQVRAAGLGLTLNGGMPGCDLCSPDPDLRRRSIRLSCEAIQAAADVESPLWGGIIYSKWLDIPETAFTNKSRVEMWNRGIDSLQQVMPVAEHYGVNVCFEIVNRFEAYMITTVTEGIRFCKEIGSPRSKLLLDSFHMNIEEDSIAGALSAAMENHVLGHLHISESNRGLPGLKATDTNWPALISTLSQIGYSGIVTMEPMVLMETPSSAKYRIWRDMIPDNTQTTLLRCAQESISYIKSLMSV